MATFIFGNHSSAIVSRRDRDSIRAFYCEVLGGTLTKADPDRDGRPVSHRPRRTALTA